MFTYLQVPTNLNGFAEQTNAVHDGHSFNVVIRVLKGALLISFIFSLHQPFKVFSLDGNTFF